MISILVALVLSLPAPHHEVTGYVWTGNRTASGTWPVVGRTAACPRSVPLGSVVFIDGIGRRVCEDRGCDCFDVFMESRRAALAWGRRERRVVVR